MLTFYVLLVFDPMFRFGDAARNAMVGFFFLRFINPALSQPEVYGLAETSGVSSLCAFYRTWMYLFGV